LWQKDPKVVWVGTGEANSRNSSSWGNGVYRSLDGGGTWKHVGLEATSAIARVVTDPADSNVAYVAALGRLWGSNPERGVFKTSDGGRTWSHVLEVDDKTGAVDLVMDPRDPKTLYAAMYSRLRLPWAFRSGSATGGIFRTRDGGRSWTKLEGLPARTGRIGLDVYRKNPDVIYAVVESDEGGQIASFEEKSRAGGVFRSDDRGEHWKRLSPFAPRPFYFSQIRVQPDDSTRVYLLGTELWVSDDGGLTFRANGGRNVHPDNHAMWIDPAHGRHVVLGTDGGVYVSHDRADTWDFLNNLATGEFYDLAVGMNDPYTICGGLQDNQSWCGPSRTRLTIESFSDEPGNQGILNDHWFCLGGGDGFHVAIDPTDANIVYYESQGGYLNRLHLDTGQERNLRPAAREGQPAFRFNWNTPFLISPHDPKVLWMGGNHVFRLEDRGNRWSLASPDLTTKNPDRMVTAGSAAETYCTIVSLAESPRKAGLLWAGTDDGKVWVRRGAETEWADVTGALRGAAGFYVACIEPSHHADGTAYVAIDPHRSNRVEPLLLRTTDFGRSFTSIAGDLPRRATVKVVREDLENPDLLFAGTEFGLYASLDGGLHWTRLKENLPMVAVDDLIIHPRERDLVVGTHGRSVYVLDDISPLEQWKPSAMDAPVTFFAPRPATAWYGRGISGIWGQRPFTAANPTFGARLDYYVPRETGDGVSITVADSAGHTIRRLTGPGSPGFHRVIWNLQGEPQQKIDRPEWNNQPLFLRAGTYTVSLKLGDRDPIKRTLVLRSAPGAEPVLE
jgi:photosystem II stability/assembly factor-like uncharacterized protein